MCRIGNCRARTPLFREGRFKKIGVSQRGEGCYDIWVATEFNVSEKDLQEKASETLDELKSSASKAILKASMDNIGGDDDSTSLFDKLKYVILIGGFAVFFVFVVLWFLGLMKWLMGAALLAGLGGVAWVLLKPKLMAFNEKLQAKRLAKRAEQERIAAEERQRELASQKAKAIDDELASLKEKALGD